MRILVVVLAAASICCPVIRHGLRLDSIDALTRDNGSAFESVADDLNECMSSAHYASGFRPIVAADFHYGFGGLLAATSDPYLDYFDVIDAAITLPLTRLAVAEDRE
ncbi:hypothetical protein [Paraburkholderia lacunae]|uniref:Uncharacterized protein n=1 Tax=Paraburkholderia lacunae TaxID=2211104 RepID=A0A370MZJ2_9BURK|nr:hypothetical protein [Paraburkholderia lacunae]RDJ98800.1 hypothetical protein DLM46_31465 [Paraburkholderia lacunae]